LKIPVKLFYGNLISWLKNVFSYALWKATHEPVAEPAALGIAYTPPYGGPFREVPIPALQRDYAASGTVTTGAGSYVSVIGSPG
jgi:hypothetical protein